VTGTQRSLKHADAASWLGISSKALRLYEDRGLLSPGRTAAGWRVYDAAELARAADIVALRQLGLSLMEVGRVVAGDNRDLGIALEAHQMVLKARQQALAVAMAKVQELRLALSEGRMPELAGALEAAEGGAGIALDLPWPWGGERFTLKSLASLTFIIGPLGSGKTRLARSLADAISRGRFLGLERLQADGAVLAERLAADAALAARITAAMAWLRDDGATESPALLALLVGLAGDRDDTVIVDMVEDGLDAATQAAVVAYLRRAASTLPRLMLMTRSSAILDLAAVRPGEAIILCPANHSPPSLVSPSPGAPGYEAVETCLASPEVRARTAGMVATRPAAAG
jgi:DNA-binding transcriptional MerR regulator